MQIWWHSCASPIVLFHKGGWYVTWYTVMNVILYKMSLFIFSSFPPSFYSLCMWGWGGGKEELIFVLNSFAVTWKSTQERSSTADSSASICMLRAQVDATMPSSSFFIPNAQELSVLLGQESVFCTCPLPLFAWHLLLDLYF